jgi:hypothetical protein
MTTNSSEIRAELADTYGMKGGIFRRMGDLAAALTAYKEGGEIGENDNLPSTYNRSNIISLSFMGIGMKPTDPEMRKRHADVIRQLEANITGPRSDEWWAWSDLAQVYLLNGEPGKARACYTKALSKTGATSDEIERHVTILEELADKTAVSAPTIAASIRAAIDELPR